MNKSPRLKKRKADTIFNGIFLILLGFLFYTGQWWPGILFAFGLTLAIRHYLTGRRLSLLFTVLSVGVLGVITLAGNLLWTLFPLFLMAGGIFLVAKEFLLFKNKPEDLHS